MCINSNEYNEKMETMDLPLKDAIKKNTYFTPKRTKDQSKLISSKNLADMNRLGLAERFLEITKESHAIMEVIQDKLEEKKDKKKMEITLKRKNKEIDNDDEGAQNAMKLLSAKIEMDKSLLEYWGKDGNEKESLNAKEMLEYHAKSAILLHSNRSQKLNTIDEDEDEEEEN